VPSEADQLLEPVRENQPELPESWAHHNGIGVLRNGRLGSMFFSIAKRPVEMAPPPVTVAEVAEYLQVPPGTIYRLLRNRVLPAFHEVGGDRRIKNQALDPGAPYRAIAGIALSRRRARA